MYRRNFLCLASSSAGWTPYGHSDRTFMPKPPKGVTADGATKGLFARMRASRQQASNNSSSGVASSSSSSPSAAKATSAGGARGRSVSYAEAAAGPAGATARPTTGVHLYANKENAWENYSDDRYYGARRFKEYWMRMLADRGVRYYVLGVLVVMLGATAKLMQLQQEQVSTNGLLGPKKKHYRSRLTVVLDLDETIVSYGDKAYRMRAGIVARPHLAELLDYLVSIDAEVVLWSACAERYMKQVLGVVDPSGIRISQYITRHRDWFTKDNYYEKNLLWLKRPMEDTIMIENRALSARNCNANTVLVDDFIRGEYMDTGQDYPPNDHALLTVKNIVADLERTGLPVQTYLQDEKHRNAEIKEIPCHLAFRQLPDELARGVFYFVGGKYKRATAQANKTSTQAYWRTTPS